MRVKWADAVSLAFSASRAILAGFVPEHARPAVDGVLKTAEVGLFRVLAHDVLVGGAPDGIPGEVRDARR